MGVSRHRARRVGTRAALALCGVALTLLAGCSADTVGELKRLGLPVAATDQAPAIGNLWIGTWIAAGSIGIAVSSRRVKFASVSYDFAKRARRPRVGEKVVSRMPNGSRIRV